MTTVDVRAAALSWLAQDPDGTTRAELEDLIARADADDRAAWDELHDRFDTRLAFGTAGLRGALGAGSNRMNRVLVGQAAAGFAAYLREQQPDATPSVVIGYDGRRNSDVFARDSAEIFAGAGLRAILLPRLLPTPVLAFAVRHLGVSAGVMVTASHNPPDDNGYKVYLGGSDDGAQIVSPADAQIAAHISAVADAADLGAIARSDAYEVADEAVLDAYVAATALVAPAPAGAAGLRWTYTAMHGVGWETLRRILETAGYPLPTVVEAQIAPDGRFPTVAFPNPEEPGAMDLAFETARSSDAELILANDPDADRLAVAIPDAGAAGGWRRLTGNEVGLLLGWRAARTATTGTLACSLVSSPGLQTVAAHYGLDFAATLTGFKWISRAEGLVYGFEEALGYLVNPGTVRDKDGISAAIAVLGLVTEAREEGRSLGDLLEEFSSTFGHFASGQVSLRVDDLALIGRIMSALRAAPPTSVGTVPVERIDDLRDAPAGEPRGDVLRLWLADGSRVIVRPSGTEPKLKAYLDVRGETAEDAAHRLADLDAGARTLLRAAQA
ncbi:phospho-sugar mutase [Microbacterium sp. EYE_5]|uniref:phospho-sugar mutase n=1 Tax=unclassified Microbacterium TaxID=2609290 RepID=UPI002004A4E2|nr:MULTISPECIES: phospho-sugar mutase [unclassified Microbacterium]MCK6081549.1 phospho-sugar mutase [Microbacterium sp. EYE_382]MCK6086819.1 phospho-sugar mutase [Microbacterium sp. EYE_384]MCK6123683.1 phospho-sugar mutase [Microbacterium sp. EYE_80]MCK6126592.1 phospho-sugar mutase [Microbacterium sp. EYE_79]MCK6142503.1 phospho-sugar mutase [Microbacterium sp. EYE_39]